MGAPGRSSLLPGLAERVYLDDIAWPVLAHTREGIIVPHAPPQPFGRYG
jgi:hypothetical protein